MTTTNKCLVFCGFKKFCCAFAQATQFDPHASPFHQVRGIFVVRVGQVKRGLKKTVEETITKKYKETKKLFLQRK